MKHQALNFVKSQVDNWCLGFGWKYSISISTASLQNGCPWCLFGSEDWFYGQKLHFRNAVYASYCDLVFRLCELYAIAFDMCTIRVWVVGGYHISTDTTSQVTSTCTKLQNIPGIVRLKGKSKLKRKKEKGMGVASSQRQGNLSKSVKSQSSNTIY